MRYSVRTLSCLLGATSIALLPVVGCSSSSSGGTTTHDSGIADVVGTPDTGHDAGHDAAKDVEVDATSDATTSSEASADAGAADGEADAAKDGTTGDAEVDAAVDGETDAAHDGTTDGPVDGEVDGPVDGAHDAADAADAEVDAHDAAPPTVQNYFMGRWDTSGVAMGVTTGVGAAAEWPGSGVLTTFSAANIGVTLTDACNTTTTGGGCDSVTIEIDGVLQATATLNGTTVTPANGSFALKSGSNTIQVNGFTAGTDHTIGVYKNTDSYFGGKITFEGFTPGGGTTVAASYTFTHHIEWIGDDITAGTGDLASTCPATISAASDEYSSYARIVSEFFNAERQNIAISNVGLVTPQGSGSLISTVYPLVLPDGTSDWNFASYTPDLVVVNLGSYGDFASTTTDPPMAPFPANFEAAYEALLATVRTKHPSAFILVVSGAGYLGSISDTSAAAEQKAAYTARLSAGETTSTIGYVQASTASTFGCDNDITATDQTSLATQVENAITTNPALSAHWAATPWKP